MTAFGVHVITVPFAALFHTIPEVPQDYGGVNVLSRMLDGLGFRYRWATDGLVAEDLAFTPGQGAMTLGELMLHLRQLVCWVSVNVQASRDGREAVAWSDACAHLPEVGNDASALSGQVLLSIATLRGDLLAMGDAELPKVRLLASSGPDHRPFWNAINGPLSDFLTHVGQVNAWRRMMGKPGPPIDVFRGEPKE
ncbi:MAG: hypothetical protein ACI9EF_002775 [Pseudohongiellaceae bacterium]|jgi:hypothetical protein